MEKRNRFQFACVVQFIFVEKRQRGVTLLFREVTTGRKEVRSSGQFASSHPVAPRLYFLFDSFENSFEISRCLNLSFVVATTLSEEKSCSNLTNLISMDVNR